jgi:hypothetical protein
MTAPWPRFTVRGLLILVAVAGVAIGVTERRERFLRRVDLLKRESVPLRLEWARACRAAGRGMETPALICARAMCEYRAVHNSRLREKYERAARYPWLPIDPDPPELK